MAIRARIYNSAAKQRNEIRLIGETVESNAGLKLFSANIRHWRFAGCADQMAV
jgi:hypothetical protein